MGLVSAVTLVSSILRQAADCWQDDEWIFI
jgi:hypothetical protein